MNTGPSALSLAAAALYGIVVVASLAAALNSQPGREPPWHRPAWICLAFIFLLLAILRIYGFEDTAREMLRATIRAENRYSDRREIQGMIAGLVIFASIVVATMFGRRLAPRIRGRRDQAVALAVAAGGGMMFLLILRLISLHAIDGLLYGPLKLNWFADIGATLAVGACALYYIVRVRSPRR